MKKLEKIMALVLVITCVVLEAMALFVAIPRQVENFGTFDYFWAAYALLFNFCSLLAYDEYKNCK